jgi:ATP-dependent helicase HrpA
MIADGYQLLAELGAIDETTKELTQVGRELAKLPLDPKIGRMILAAREHNCLREVLIIASALGTQDPRDRPQEQAATADQAHAKWKDEKSEFLSYLKLWAAAMKSGSTRPRTSSASGAGRISSTGCACASGATFMRSC